MQIQCSLSLVRDLDKMGRVNPSDYSLTLSHRITECRPRGRSEPSHSITHATASPTRAEVPTAHPRHRGRGGPPPPG
jgi:hypothetical protein